MVQALHGRPTKRKEQQANLVWDECALRCPADGIPCTFSCDGSLHPLAMTGGDALENETMALIEIEAAEYVAHR